MLIMMFHAKTNGWKENEFFFKGSMGLSPDELWARITLDNELITTPLRNVETYRTDA